MDNSIPGAKKAPQGSSTTVNPNARRGPSTTVNPNARRGSSATANPNASNSNGTTVNPNANRERESHRSTNREILPVGTVIDGKYQVMAPMTAAGAEAKLYIGASIGTGEELCIKLYLDSEHVRSDVRDALLRINHRNIANLHSWGYWEGMIYEIWTLYKGQNLQQAISRSPLSETQINGYLRQMNNALQTLHNAGLVHQDIKPANFMVVADGSVVLIDFGVSASSDVQGRTHVTQIGHTTDYSSPEVLFTKFCWAASDYYSLGVTLFEMLTGTTPYADYDETMTMRKLDDIRETYIPGIEEFSVKMQDLIRGLMQYNKDKRWGYDAVQAWLADNYQKYKVEWSDRKDSHNEAQFKFGGKEYSVPSEIPELITRMAFDWDAGIKYMDGDGRFVLLRDRLAGVDDELWVLCNETRSDRDANLNYFTKLYKLYPALPIFAWRGYTAENAQKLGEAILNAMWQNKIKEETRSSSRSSNPFGNQFGQSHSELTYSSLEDIFTKHVIPQYLKFTGNSALAAKVSEYESEIAKCWRQNQNADLWYYRIGYALSGSTKLRLGPSYYENKAAFVKRVNDIIETCKNAKNNDAFIDFCRLIYNAKMDPGFAAWAEALGMGDEVAKLEKALKGREQ